MTGDKKCFDPVWIMNFTYDVCNSRESQFVVKIVKYHFCVKPLREIKQIGISSGREVKLLFFMLCLA